MGGKEWQGHGLPTAELKVESTITAAEAWPSSFFHHLFCKEGSRERPQHVLLTCWSHGLQQRWGLGKEMTFLPQGRAPSATLLIQAPNLGPSSPRTPTFNPTGSPGVFLQRVLKSIHFSLAVPLSRPPSPPTWGPERVFSHDALLHLFLPTHSSQRDAAKMSVTSLSSLEPFKLSPPLFTLSPDSWPPPSRGFLGRSPLQPHTSWFPCRRPSCCLCQGHMPPCSPAFPPWPFRSDPSSVRTPTLRLYLAACPPTVQEHSARCWPPLVGWLSDWL